MQDRIGRRSDMKKDAGPYTKVKGQGRCSIEHLQDREDALDKMDSLQESVGLDRCRTDGGKDACRTAVCKSM